MKKASVTVTFDSEKLDVLNYHLDKKQILLEDEIYQTILKLYEKYVPQPTREYIESKAENKQKTVKNQPKAENNQNNDYN